MDLHTVHAQEKSGVSTNRQMIPCVRVFVLRPRSENRSLDLFCTLPTPLTLLRALLSSLPSLFFLHSGLARHLPLYFLLIISFYPLGGPREAALESPPAHKAGVFLHNPAYRNNQCLCEEKVFHRVSQTKTRLLECKNVRLTETIPNQISCNRLFLHIIHLNRTQTWCRYDWSKYQ